MKCIIFVYINDLLRIFGSLPNHRRTISLRRLVLEGRLSEESQYCRFYHRDPFDAFPIHVLLYAPF